MNFSLGYYCLRLYDCAVLALTLMVRASTLTGGITSVKLEVAR